MEPQKDFKNNIVIFSEEILYYHGQVRIDSDKTLEQGKIVKVPNPKAGLTFYIIEYDLNSVSDLEADFFRNKFLPQRQRRNY